MPKNRNTFCDKEDGHSTFRKARTGFSGEKLPNAVGKGFILAKLSPPFI